MSDHRQKVERHAASVLAPDERLLASVRAMPVGPFGGSMGIFAGAVVGAVIQAVAVSRSVKRARLSGFPIAGRMAVAITDRRILVWQRGGVLGGTITKLIGEVPLTRIAGIEVEPVPGRSKLTFVFRDARKVTVEADKRDSPDRFAEVIRPSSAPGGVPASAAPTPSQWFATATPPPEAVPVAAPAAATSVATALAGCFSPFTRPSQPVMPRPGPGGALAGAQPLGAPPAPAGSWTLPQPPRLRLPAPSAQQPTGWPVAAKIGAALVALLLTGAAVIALGRTQHSRISIPDSIAGAQRIVTPASHQAEQQILEGAKRYGVTARAGFYGSGALPSFAVVAYDYHPGPADTPESIMRGLASGVSGSGTGSSVDLSRIATDSVGGVTYRCVRVVGQAGGAICMWEETDVLGVVLALSQGIPQARLLTDTVRSAVES